MKSSRGRKGASMAELGASLIVVVPLILLILFVGVEMSHAYMINSVLSQAAEQAARNMALQYSSDSTVSQSRTVQDSLVYDLIRNSGIINASEQFDDAVFDTASNPQTVTVTVEYTGGEYGLTQFPEFDPLNLGSAIRLRASAVYRLN